MHDLEGLNLQILTIFISPVEVYTRGVHTEMPKNYFMSNSYIILQ